MSSLSTCKSLFKATLVAEIRKCLAIRRYECLDDLDSLVGMCCDISDTEEHQEILKWASEIYDGVVNDLEFYVSINNPDVQTDVGSVCSCLKPKPMPEMP